MLSRAEHAFTSSTHTINLAHACTQVAAQLQLAGFDADDARREARQLLRLATGYTITQQVAHPHAVLTESVLERLNELTVRRAAREPLAYLEGAKEFMGLRFAVSPATLIPRPDSETLVEAALAHMPERQHSHVLDLGTGTGCLLLSILHARPLAQGVGTDRVADACALAAANAESLGLAERAQFAVGSWWDALPEGTAAFDVVISNPPYIASADQPTLMADVRDYEPASALFAADEGLAEYRTIVARAAQYLKPEGVLLFEVGATQAYAVQAIAERAGLRYLSTHNDLAGMARVVAFRAAAV